MAGALSSLGFRNVRGQYFFEYQTRGAASWINDAASIFDTDSPYELYKFLGMPPVMSEWTGERKRQQLTDFGLTVVSKKFESTIEVDVDDLRRDKTGQALMRVRDMAAKAATLPERVLTPLLEANGTGYDGVAFFATTHAVGSSGTLSNAITVTGITDPDNPTTAEMVTVILKAVQQAYLFNDDRGDPINEDATRFMVMVPVKYWAATRGALFNEFSSTGASNTLLNAGVTIVPRVNPRLNNTTGTGGRRIYVFRTDANIRALLWQDEVIGDAFKTLGEDSDNGFWRDTVAFGAKRIGQGALGRWELAVRATLSP